MSRDLDDLVDLGGLSPEEQGRLRRVHGLLLDAGPSADLPTSLVQPPADAGALVVPIGARRRPLVALLAAASVAAACFGAGYLIADQAHPSSTQVAQVVSLQAPDQRNSFASLRVGPADANGNSPIQLTVTGLPPLSTRARYVLMLSQNGKPSSLCGTFRVGRSGPTTVSFSVPYRITKSTRFVVTEMAPGAHFPGPVVMTSS
jgi:hypothetical protein